MSIEEFGLERFEQQIETLQDNPHARIMGSIGRMVYAQTYGHRGHPYVEFQARVQAHLPEYLEPSDIDVLGVTDKDVYAAEMAGPVHVDTRAFHDTDVSVEVQDGAYWLSSQNMGFERELTIDFMEPFSARVLGVDIVTIYPKAHFMLHTLRGSQHPKDEVAKVFLAEMVKRDPSEVNPHDVRTFEELTSRFEAARSALGVETGRHSSDDERHSSRY